MIFAEIGKEAQKYIQAGKLVPDLVMISFIKGEINKLDGKSWLLDGRILIIMFTL